MEGGEKNEVRTEQRKSKGAGSTVDGRVQLLMLMLKLKQHQDGTNCDEKEST